MTSRATDRIDEDADLHISHIDLEKAAKEIESSETDMFSMDDDNQLSEKKEAPPKKPED